MKIILGSQSQQRKRVLKEMGYEFEVLPADIDEKKIRHEDPRQLTVMLAKAKASAICSRISEPALIITADQVVVCNGKVYEKPRDVAEAKAFLQSYADYPAECVNGVVVTNTATGKQIEG